MSGNVYVINPDGTPTKLGYVSTDGIQVECALLETAAPTTPQTRQDMAETLAAFGKAATPAVQSRGPKPRKRIPPRNLRPKRNAYQR